ncbi:DUF1576 domain-containing protein [Cetobacterium somerae]|uniref:DUF1576 domain-containing protein n=1 Tax=Cetobacterium sp. NK01 TaxID=2993530 RepID=UPI00211612BD|nr:DUF1576 domain-containing protein [Cetobacterium sp. NK01]MCQ8211982.1 DUF1576 domain-containing protein [Cetobacterium sp. NK01]
MDNFKGNRSKKIWLLTEVIAGILFAMFVYFVFRGKENVLGGFIRILTSPTVLITDFLVIGGMGATFLNAFLIFIFNYTLMRLLGTPLNGIAIASFFTVFGFSFFGKNILNILPFYVGGILYSKYEHIDFKDILVTISFTSALAPFISEVAFNIHVLSEYAYINAIVLGIVIGFIVTPLAKKMAGFHEGFNLYNLGFTGGILGAVIASVLKLYQFVVVPQRIISTEHDLELKVIASGVFLSLIFIGYYINNKSFAGYKTLLKDTGLKSDFVVKYGYGLTFINMGIMGFVAMMYPILLGQTLNGPLLAGILTIVGFSAYGKTILNITPILLGVFLGKFGSKTDGFTIALSGLFGTSLAPVAGVYGPIWGVVAGMLHIAVVQSIGVIHGGLNLYNNGFSAGIIAGFLLPIINTTKESVNKRRAKYLQRQKALHDLIRKTEDNLHDDYK